MIVAALVQAVVTVISYIDSIVPEISWPSWIDTPTSWLSGHMIAGTFSVNGLTAYIHPLTIDLALFMVVTRRVVRTVMATKERLNKALGVAQSRAEI